jgi:hypothetical protein
MEEGPEEEGEATAFRGPLTCSMVACCIRCFFMSRSCSTNVSFCANFFSRLDTAFCS